MEARRTEVIYYRHNRDCPPFALEREIISFYELTIVEKGSLTYLLDGRETVIGEGDALFAREGTVRQRPRTDEPANYVSFNFRTDKKVDLPVVMHGILDEPERALIAAADALDSCYGRDKAQQMSHLFSCVLEGVSERFKTLQEHPVVRLIKQYVDMHLADVITLKDIGEYCYFSPIYCESVFKRATGVPIMRYVTEKRMDKAQRLITEGALPLRKVAESVGYADYNYFARTFKKVTGRTPKNAMKA